LKVGEGRVQRSSHLLLLGVPEGPLSAVTDFLPKSLSDKAQQVCSTGRTSSIFAPDNKGYEPNLDTSRAEGVATLWLDFTVAIVSSADVSEFEKANRTGSFSL